MLTVLDYYWIEWAEGMLEDDRRNNTWPDLVVMVLVVWQARTPKGQWCLMMSFCLTLSGCWGLDHIYTQVMVLFNNLTCTGFRISWSSLVSVINLLCINRQTMHLPRYKFIHLYLRGLDVICWTVLSVLTWQDVMAYLLKRLDLRFGYTQNKLRLTLLWLLCLS